MQIQHSYTDEETTKTIIRANEKKIHSGLYNTKYGNKHRNFNPYASLICMWSYSTHTYVQHFFGVYHIEIFVYGREIVKIMSQNEAKSHKRCIQTEQNTYICI